MVRKTTVASPRPWLCLRSVRDSLRCDPEAHPTSRALPTPPSPPRRRQLQTHPPPPREACPRPLQLHRGSAALTTVRCRPLRPAPVRRNCTRDPPPSPQSAAATLHRGSGALNPVCRRRPVRGRPVRPPPSRPPQLHRGSAALTTVRRRRPVRPPPIRHRSRGHRRPPTALLWPTPEPPSLSTVHRCPESRGYQLLRSCKEGGKIYLLCSMCHQQVSQLASFSFFLEQVLTFLENSLTNASSVNVRGV
jgi:hypothetical protein